mgnify:CR=1 FL=1
MGDSVGGGTKDDSVRSAMTSVDSESSSNLKAMGYNVEVDRPDSEESDSGRPIGTYVLYLLLAAAILSVVVSLL